MMSTDLESEVLREPLLARAECTINIGSNQMETLTEADERTESIDEEPQPKSLSDGDLRQKKDHAFSFLSTPTTPSSTNRSSWTAASIDKAKRLWGRVTRARSEALPPSQIEAVYVRPQRHTHDGSDGDLEKNYFANSQRTSTKQVSFRDTVVVDDQGEEDSFVSISGIRRNTFGDESVGDLGQVTHDAEQVAKALQTCQRRVLQPYSILLKLIGWRRFRKQGSDLTQPVYIKLCNFIYPILVSFLLIICLAFQAVICFSRSQLFVDNINGSFVSYCTDHVFTSEVIPDMLILMAYLYGLYLIRISLSEQLHNVMERTFLSFIHVPGGHEKIGRVVIMQTLILVLGVGLFVFSVAVNILRLVAYNPVDRIIQLSPIHDNKMHEEQVRSDLQDAPMLRNTTLSEIATLSSTVQSDPFIGNDALVIAFTVVVFLGFVLFDVFYVVVIINYASQCQLLIVLIHNICEKIRSTFTPVDLAIQDIQHLKLFLRALNDRLAHCVSMLLFLFISVGIKLVLETVKLPPLPRDSRSDYYMYAPYFLSIFGLIQWWCYALIPIVQAVRLTYAGRYIRRLGLDIRARPYLYVETSQLELDSFEQFCLHSKVEARLVQVPLYPSVVLFLLFVGGIFAYFFGGVTWIPWF